METKTDAELAEEIVRRLEERLEEMATPFNDLFTKVSITLKKIPPGLSQKATLTLSFGDEDEVTICLIFKGHTREAEITFYLGGSCRWSLYSIKGPRVNLGSGLLVSYPRDVEDFFYNIEYLSPLDAEEA